VWAVQHFNHGRKHLAMNRNLWLMIAAQGLFLTNNVVFIAINGLVGLSLAPYSWMATLPVMGYVVGGALATGPVAWTQSRWGRKVSFQLGLAVALVSALTATFAVLTSNFWLLVSATMVAGYYQANGQLYRFAAAELAKPDFRERAVSLVLAGGLVGAVAGPNLAKWTQHVGDKPFAGAYATLAVVALISMGVVALVKFPSEPPKKKGASGGRPLSEIMRQPVFIVSTAAAALGYGVMNLLMAASPIAMQVCGHPFKDAALVLEWHVIGMFAPGFFTGNLIKRFGVIPIMATGVVLNLACIGIALSGIEVMDFLLSMFLLGVGWNFLFTAGTALSLKAYRPEEKDKVQGAINFCVFATMALSSFSSGALVTTQGWTLLNYGSLVPVVLTGIAVIWYVLQGRRHQPA
jgi:predicted MFS family arabinose efflux permease